MRRLIFLVLLAALFLSLGCISYEQEKKPQNVTTLRIGYQPMAHHLAAMVAQAKGWWLEDLKPFGVKEVKTFPFPFGGPEIKSMGSGDLDVIYI
ncbi:MAG TPA: sulfonate ABC transporter substrate-binding protein, partial [Methanothrix sp.]|nr:sulfonate ABC transporter substrate-binding protein [Methanothrix sp.]